MPTIPNADLSAGGQPDDARTATERYTSIFLQPIAAPSVLGYFAGATGFLLFGVWLGGSLGGPANAIVLFPFLLLFAGIGQLVAGMWSYRPRDAVAASIHGVWGGFWLAYGLLWLLDAAGTITLPLFANGFQPLGRWFIYMAVITWTTAFAALGRSPAQFVSQATAAAASTIAAGRADRGLGRVAGGRRMGVRRGVRPVDVPRGGSDAERGLWSRCPAALQLGGREQVRRTTARADRIPAR
jgi:succinate-acetate transporter protein